MTKNKPPRHTKNPKKTGKGQNISTKAKLQQNKQDKLELLQFPCDFPIKVFSHSEFNLEEFATSIVHKHSPDMEFIPTTTHNSSKGNYLSVTVVIKAISKEHIDCIYQDLVANKNIIMVL